MSKLRFTTKTFSSIRIKCVNVIKLDRLLCPSYLLISTSCTVGVCRGFIRFAKLFLTFKGDHRPLFVSIDGSLSVHRTECLQIGVNGRQVRHFFENHLWIQPICLLLIVDSRFYSSLINALIDWIQWPGKLFAKPPNGNYFYVWHSKAFKSAALFGDFAQHGYALWCFCDLCPSDCFYPLAGSGCKQSTFYAIKLSRQYTGHYVNFFESLLRFFEARSHAVSAIKSWRFCFLLNARIG